MKRLFLLITAIVLAFSLVGCKTEPKADPVIDDVDPSAGELTTHLIAKAEYPAVVQYPYSDPGKPVGDYEEWREDVNRRLDFHYEGLNIDSFIKESTAELLSGKGENKVYSPLNIYIALSMLAEITDGDTRAQIMKLFGEDDILAVRDNAMRLWNSNYSDNGQLTTILANSVWMSEDIDYNEQTLNILAKEYFASSYSGKMGDADYSKELRNWINEQTKGFLSDQVGNVELDPETVMSLVSTIYFKGNWQSEFVKQSTLPDTFYAKDGEMTVDFMNQTEYLNYYDGDGFTAVKKGFNGNSSMYLILPDEETEMNDLTASSALNDFIISPDGALKEQDAYVKLSVPKFDIDSDFNLSDALKTFGITDAFDPTVSDFSPICNGDSDIAVTEAKHTARVMIDEKGCVAASVNMIASGSGGYVEPPEPIVFELDRPFIFVIASATGIPLFVGTVNQP